MRMCFFGCISLVRVFILRVPEFSLSSYNRSSKYFLAVDFIILRESFSINFCLCFLLPIAVTDARVGKIEEKLSLILQKKLVSTRELASITGSVISLSPVFGNLSRIMSRHCQISIAASPGWDFVSELDSYCVAELQFWLSTIKKYNSKNCFQYSSHNQIVYSDASGFACGAIIFNNSTQICHRPFTQEERAFSSTHRDLIAIEYSLKAFGPILRNSRVEWFTDSQSSVRIVEVGRMKFSLHTLATSIFEFCIRNNIELSIQWIPRSLNQKAHSVSKFMDIDD